MIEKLYERLSQSTFFIVNEVKCIRLIPFDLTAYMSEIGFVTENEGVMYLGMNRYNVCPCAECGKVIDISKKCYERFDEYKVLYDDGGVSVIKAYAQKEAFK